MSLVIRFTMFDIKKNHLTSKLNRGINDIIRSVLSAWKNFELLVTFNLLIKMISLAVNTKLYENFLL